MKIGIVYSADPIYMDPYILEIIKTNQTHIAFVMMTQGDITKKKNTIDKIKYGFTLFLILGIRKTFLNVYKILEKRFFKANKIQDYCNNTNIPFKIVSSINSKEAIEYIKKQHVDLILNQSQHIIKREVLNIPKIGIINRHGALLPKYRGRLAPFWQLYNNEKYGGVTYHFVNEKIDDGQIILQRKIKIEKNDTFNSLVKKMFENAIDMFPQVIEKLDNKSLDSVLVENDKNNATYYTSPEPKHAFKYRLKRWGFAK